MSDRGSGGEFDRLVPRWMFALRSGPARVLAAVVIPVVLSVPLVIIPDADDLRLGPYLVLGVVGVAAIAGWWATTVSGLIVIGLYWWYGVPADRSFRLEDGGDVVALGAMVLLVVGITAMARRVERAVEDVRALDEQRRDRVTQLEQAFAERDRIARTLSTTLLPPRLPVLQGFTAAGWVLPAHADEVAGDFYDLFSVAGDDWVGVLGDVCGKGAEAAAVTSLARYAARVAALEDAHPAHIAHVANAALVEDPSDLFCTMGIVRYRHDSELLEVTLAGHPQTRVVSGGQVTRVGRFGAALGYATKPAIVDCRPLLPGDTVVLFSDGLIERNPSFGEDDFDRALAEIPSGVASEVAEHIRARITEVPAARHDDLALLVIQRAP